jgi:hypothetical protein
MIITGSATRIRLLGLALMLAALPGHAATLDGAVVVLDASATRLRVSADLGPALGLGMKAGGVVVAAMIAADEQAAADNAIAPMLSGLPERFVSGHVVGATRSALEAAGHAPAHIVLVDKPAVAAFSRIDAAKTARHWILIAYEADGNAATTARAPVALTPDHRHLRIAMRVTVFEHRGAGAHRRLSERRVAVVSPAIQAAAPVVSLARLAAEEGALLGEMLRASIADAIALALEDAPVTRAGRDEQVDLLTPFGAQRIPGRLLRHHQGRALLVSPQGVLLLVPALRVL